SASERGAPDAEREIRAALREWADDWNAGRLAPVCDLFAKDVVLSFPGGPDRDWKTMCDGFARLFAGGAPTLRYDPPEIEEVLVSGDLAAVRVVWTLRRAPSGD